ncbi:MAG: hypothetical protein ACKE5M_06620 [Methylophilaceae bacterium]
MFANTPKIILCVTNQSLTAGLWYGTKLQSYKVFNNQDDGHTAFSQYMAEHEDINVYLIADAIEEDYKLEALPHTTGSARREIVTRKLSQFNRNSIYRTAHYINRDTDKRKDDNYIFVALNNTDFMQHWMDVIQAEHIPLVGVYLLPMISQVIVRQMKLMAPHILLCERLSSGLRQTYLHNGRLRMSRLTPMRDIEPEQAAYFYQKEIEKTQLYLLSQRLIPADATLQMVLPAYDDTSNKIANSISQEQGIECKTVDILAYAKNNNLKPKVVKAHPELLHMQLLANGNIPDNLAPVTLTKTHNIKNLCRNIHIASILLAVVGVLFSVVYFFQGLQNSNQINEMVAKTDTQLSRYELVAQNFPDTPIPGGDLKTAVEIASSINNQTPRQMMTVLSAALEDAPEIAISRIRWIQSNQADIKDENGVQAQQTAVAGNPQELKQIGFINAEIRRFKGDYRAALASASRFAANLRANPLVAQVQILQEPVNVSSLASLEGSTKDESTAQRAPAVFKLKVVLKPINKEAAL